MAYENYFYVSWAAGTPLTSGRFEQMSLNIQQIKDAATDNPNGILQFNQSTTASANWNDFAVSHEIINLVDNTGTGGLNQQVAIDASRYYKVAINIPGIVVWGPGSEDSTFKLELYRGISTGNAATLISTWKITPSTFSYLNVASAAANIANEAVKSNSYPSIIGGATYSVIQQTTTALTQQSFYAAITRDQGASSNNSPSFAIYAATGAPIQLYVEDVGGVY